MDSEKEKINTPQVPKRIMPLSILDRAKLIKLIAFDVDGVLTDGGIYYGEGIELKRFHSQDGAGITMARRAGIKVCFITGRKSAAVERRAQELSVDHVHQAIGNKIDLLETITNQEGLKREQVCFMGDDVLDLPAMVWSGLAIAPANATQDVKEIAHHVTLSSGGNGAVRDAVEIILRTQERWDEVVKTFVEEKMGIAH